MLSMCTRRVYRTLLAATALATLGNAVAWAQTAPAAGDAEADEMTAIIITATSRARVALDTPLAVSQVSEAGLARLGVSSQADILNSIPTIKADAGGGEVASNVFVRGLPSGGQYQFTPLMYDGLPVLSSFGLNSSAYDVYYRNDLGIERLEFVRGGVSNLFGPGSVAGLINYISKTGGSELAGTAQLEVAEKDRYRGDFAISGPIGENLRFALSGFYRTDKGPIKTGLDTKGFQLRGNLKYNLPDGTGSVTLYGQYIDDKAVFYLPLPLDGTTRDRIPGNDGKQVFQVLNNRVGNLGFNTPDGRFSTSILDGVTAKGGQAAIAFQKDFGDSGWGVNGKIKYSDYKHKFGLWSDGDGVVNVPETLAAFVSNTARRGLIPELNGIGVGNAAFSFVGGGTAPANTILFANRFTDRDRPMHDFTAEFNLTKQLETGNVEHSITLGGFYGDASADDINVTTTYLAEFNNQPRLVNLVVTNPTTGVATTIASNGLLNAGAGYVNNRHSVKRYAGYIANQMEVGDKFNVDLGFRIEKLEGDIRRERTSTTITDTTTPGLSAALRDVIWGNDAALSGTVSTSEWAGAIGVLYKATDRVSLYINASRGYFFPEIRAVGFATLPAGTAATASLSPGTASYKGEIIRQIQGGVKISQPRFSFEAAAFFTDLKNRRQVLFVNAPGGGFQELVNLVATQSYGVEATLDFKLIDNLRFNGNLTLQKAKYTEFQTNVGGVPTSNPAIIGNDLERQPQFMYNAGLYYDDGALDVSFFTNYTDDNFTASNNAIRLSGWNVFNLDAGYRLEFGQHSFRLGVNVFNLFDTDATTEGSPRQDVNQTVGGAYFVGRPVLPRRVMGRLTYNF
jgi:iron complex outermembrane recepter protein